MNEYTLVIGTDDNHFAQLCLVWPTWIKHKPDLLKQPLVIFYDRDSTLSVSQIQRAIKHPQLRIVEWPDDASIRYVGDPHSKWYHPQRYKMLAGFVHVPARMVSTPYWLKIDTDVVATGVPDWIDTRWFDNVPSIVAHRWFMTKPPNQMDLLDKWVDANRQEMLVLSTNPPLNLHPEEGADKIQHKRIISWCGFFNTVMTRYASKLAEQTCGPGQLPVPSQDGYLWYIASRMKTPIVRTNMKSLGWEWWSTMGNVRQAVDRSLSNGK